MQGAVAVTIDLSTPTGLIESGEVVPVIDRAYELPEVAKAVAAQGAGHRRGKTVVTV